jgi:hypothetical protein
MLALGRTAGNGIAFLVAAGIVYEIIAANCSSPQTVEINAAKRAPTLMKWVHIGQVQSIGFIAVAAAMDKKHQIPILAGGITAMVLMEGLYMHGKQSGLSNGGEPSEQY